MIRTGHNWNKDNQLGRREKIKRKNNTEEGIPLTCDTPHANFFLKIEIASFVTTPKRSNPLTKVKNLRLLRDKRETTTFGDFFLSSFSFFFFGFAVSSPSLASPSALAFPSPPVAGAAEPEAADGAAAPASPSPSSFFFTGASFFSFARTASFAALGFASC